MANCSAVELDDRKDCSVAAYQPGLESFTIADKELDHAESLKLQIMDSDASAMCSDEDTLDGTSFGSMRGTSRNSTESDD
ncbi:hypothetical protein EDD22DRAFT_950857 [Suillus occidentalis]|nr:hypothetical protein EDD22DRAFT_950857 [Suillus occidentalis]